MVSSKFFTNDITNTLFDKFKGIIEGMHNLHSFHAVVGYFRSSGYFKIRKELCALENPPKIQILIGINIDNIFRRHNKSMLFIPGDKINDEAREQYRKDFVEDVKNAGYYKDIEEGILMLAEDLQSGLVELRIHPTRDLHAKFYLFLPEKHTQHSDGWVIMGSSNLSASGLGLTEPPRYELNVAMKDYDDVAFCKGEFDTLWSAGLPINFEDVEEFKKQTHLGQNPTPYELYIKLLIDYFGEQVEDDFTLEVPEGFKNLKYQKDAVTQGYQMLIRNNGFFLADVVGLGKTVIATMIAKRFIEENGRDTRVLVVYPPALAANWEDTFKHFKIKRNNADFVSCGSLDKVLDGNNKYEDIESYDLILVDEAHRFRSDSSQMYDALQRICKADRENVGRVGDKHKKVMLISATPLNNRPNDLYALLQLFQDRRKCTIDGVPNLQNKFAPWIAKYKTLTSSKNEGSLDVEAVKALYDEIRTEVIDKVTVRRTRNNIINYSEYKADLTEQGIVFPEIEKPREVEYILSGELKTLFESTMLTLTDGLLYARYKAIEALDPTILADKYSSIDAKAISRNLATIYRTHMVKRLESSFYALRRSLHNLRRATQGMVDMFEADKVIIAPDLKVKELQAKGLELDDIIEMGIKKLGVSKDDFVYPASAFRSDFIEDLHYDISTLDALINEWEAVSADPKLDIFIERLENNLFDKSENPEGKLVVFSESKDTIEYLTKELKERLGRTDILSVSSDNRKKDFELIQANFDANYPGKRSDKYNIIITTDVLAEGVNLHRANVIVNYDTPWNATRLMQRIGRVNRIGSVAGLIVNYLFYPSAEGDAQIKLYKNALAKLQGFHSAYGEDSQIYSKEEIVEQFELFNANIGDDVDKSLALLNIVRDFRRDNEDEYERIKNLPIKSRTARSTEESSKAISKQSTLVYVASSYKTEFYKVEGGTIKDMGFLDVIDLFEAKPDEVGYDVPDSHYQQVKKAYDQFDEDVIKMLDDDTKMTPSDKDSITDRAKKMLRDAFKATKSSKIKDACDILAKYVELGTYSKLNRDLSKMENKFRKDKIALIEVETAIKGYVAAYHNRKNRVVKEEDITPYVVISETFI
ncbi:MAG: helicase-related protein [Rikenellaceae bacterium]